MSNSQQRMMISSHMLITKTHIGLVTSPQELLSRALYEISADICKLQGNTLLNLRFHKLQILLKTMVKRLRNLFGVCRWQWAYFSTMTRWLELRNREQLITMLLLDFEQLIASIKSIAKLREKKLINKSDSLFQLKIFSSIFSGIILLR